MSQMAVIRDELSKFRNEEFKIKFAGLSTELEQKTKRLSRSNAVYYEQYENIIDEYDRFIGEVLYKFQEPLDSNAEKVGDPGRERFLSAVVIYCYAEASLKSFLAAMLAKCKSLLKTCDRGLPESQFTPTIPARLNRGNRKLELAPAEIRRSTRPPAAVNLAALNLEDTDCISKSMTQIKDKINDLDRRAIDKLGFLSDKKFLGASSREPATCDQVWKIYVLCTHTPTYKIVESFRTENGLSVMPDYNKVMECIKISKSKYIKDIHKHYPVNRPPRPFYGRHNSKIADYLIQIINYTEYPMTAFSGLTCQTGLTFSRPKFTKNVDPYCQYTTGSLNNDFNVGGCIYLYMDGVRKPHHSPHSHNARKFGFAFSKISNFFSNSTKTANLLDGINFGDQQQLAESSRCGNNRGPIFWNNQATPDSEIQYFTAKCFINIPPHRHREPALVVWKFIFQQYDPIQDMEICQECLDKERSKHAS